MFDMFLQVVFDETFSDCLVAVLFEFPHEIEKPGDLIKIKVEQVQTWLLKGVKVDDK